jgi:carbamoyl-phosphate synthase large subunit
MKATGEVMAIGATFEEAIMNAVRGAEISTNSLNSPKFAGLGNDALIQKIKQQDDERIFAVYEALKRGYTKDEMHTLTKIDNGFCQN